MVERVIVIAYTRQEAKAWADKHLECHERMPMYIGASTDMELNALSGMRCATIIVLDVAIPQAVRYKLNHNTIINIMGR